MSSKYSNVSIIFNEEMRKMKVLMNINEIWMELK